MYTVSVRAHYDAAHFLKNYEGKCARMHGHHYVVEIAVQTAELDGSGMAFDFVDLKREVRALAEELDHQNLNELPQFEDVETTAEVQARWFFEELKTRLPGAVGAGLLFARIWESPTQWAQYSPVPGLAPPSSYHEG